MPILRSCKCLCSQFLAGGPDQHQEGAPDQQLLLGQSLNRPPILILCVLALSAVKIHCLTSHTFLTPPYECHPEGLQARRISDPVELTTR